MKKIISFFAMGLFTYIISPLLFAKPSCTIDFSRVPQYQGIFSFPIQNIDLQYLVIRFYQSWGDGSDIGWQTHVTPPSVTLDGKPLLVEDIFSYVPDSSFGYGAIGLGYDQYAQYFLVNLPFGSFNLDSKLIMTGIFQQAAYLSTIMYITADTSMQKEILDNQMTVLDNACNPYVEHNPSIFAYPTTEHFIKSFSMNDRFNNIYTKIRSIQLKKHFASFDSRRLGEIPFFRLDQETSQDVIADGIAADGCSSSYLVAQKKEDQEVLILRIKVPDTFIINNSPDKVFHKYQVRYFSISSHRNNYNENDPNDILLNYWGVNTRMLNNYKDKDGYAYVFFAPNNYTNNLAIEQHTQSSVPPVMTWGHYKGFLLGEPDYAVILRYRVPALKWTGSPERATCYATPETNRPVNKSELGDFMPEMFGDTLDNFLNGKIGAVQNNSSWPIR